MINTELAAFIGAEGGSYYNTTNGYWENQTITGGAWAEDKNDPWGRKETDASITTSHFWNADNGDLSSGYLGDINAYRKGKSYWQGGWWLIERYDAYSHADIFTKTDSGQLIIPANYGIVFEAPGLAALYKTKRIKILGYYTHFTGRYFPSAPYENPSNSNSSFVELNGMTGYEVYIDNARVNKFVWNILGRICHLLQDMSVPVHTKLLPHPCGIGPGDSYERWISAPVGFNGCPGFNWDFAGKQWNYQNAITQGGLINVIGDAYPLRYLFYTTNQIT